MHRNMLGKRKRKERKGKETAVDVLLVTNAAIYESHRQQ